MNARMLFILRGFAVLLFIFLPAFAQAATLHVPSYSYPTIQSGIAAAQNGDTVLVADGTYSGYGNCDIDFLGKNITVTSQNGAAKTIIDCQGSAASPHRGFDIHSGEMKATISGFTVKNGYEYGNGGGIDIENFSGGTINVAKCIITGNTTVSQYGGGGGIYSSGSGTTINITDCTVTGNAAPLGGGGGIENSNNGNNLYPFSTPRDSTITLTRCTVSGNSASYGGGISNLFFGANIPSTKIVSINLTDCAITQNSTFYGGGGVYNHSDNTSNSVVAMTNCTVAANTVASQYSAGGGVENNGGGTVTLSRCTVTGNAAPYGGGILTINSVGSTVTVSACTIADNTAQGGVGGGIEDYSTGSGGTITLLSCMITGNSSSSGGGVYNYSSNGGANTMTACTVSGNTAQHSGGGLVNANSGGGTTALTNCVVFGNTVTSGVGGGAYNSNDNTSGDTITLTNCTFTGNNAVYGGGSLYNDNFYGGTVMLINDIAYGDMSIKNENPITGSTNVIANNCDIQGGYPGTSNIEADPQFVNAATGDVHLKPGSPCLGAGTSNGAPSIDKDGQFRPNPPSIGAYELKVPPATITSFVLSSDSIDAPGTRLSAFVTASGIFSKVTVSVPRGNLSIVSPTFTLINYGGSPYWYGTIPTAFLKLAKINPVTFVATGTRADGTTATLTTTLQINNLPALTVYIYPDTAIVNRNGNFNLFAFAGNFSGRPALYTTVQITLPPGIDYVSAPGFTYNASSRTLTQGVPSLNFQPFNLVFRASATASTQTPLTLSIMASCPGFQNVTQNETILVVP